MPGRNKPVLPGILYAGIILGAEHLMITYSLLLIIGILAGTLGAMVGLGGGVIMLPAIQLLLAYDLLIVVGTTLFAVIFTSLSAVLGHYKAGNVRFPSAAWVGVGGLCGVLLGSFIFKQYLSNCLDIIKMILGLLFAIIALRFSGDIYKATFHKGSLEQNLQEASRQPVTALIALGIFSGSLTGIVGLGGGFILTPGIMYICGFTPQIAVGTAMLAMLPVSLSGGLIKLVQGYVNLPAGIILGLGTALGAQLGVKLVSRISAVVMKGIFVIVFLSMAIYYILPVM